MSSTSSKPGQKISIRFSRVIAATLSDMYSAVTGAIGALKGPLHGGANEQVMRMLLKITEPERAKEWVIDALARKEKIMGFGHRVYRTEDPRATHLRNFSKEMGERNGEPQWEWFQTRRPSRIEADHKRVSLLFADELQMLTSLAL